MKIDTNAIIMAQILGGGGGSSVTVEPLSVTANGEYTAPTGKAYSPVTVNVSGSKPSYLISDGDTVSTFYFNTAYALGTWLATLTYSDLDPDTGLYVCYTGLGYFYGVDLTSGQYALVWNDGVNIVPIYSTVAVPAFGVTEAGWQMASYTPSVATTVVEEQIIPALWEVIDEIVAKDDIVFGDTIPEYFVTFKGDQPFTLQTNNGAKNWDGTLYYSTNKKNWYTWNGTSVLSTGTKTVLYLCGVGNTKICGSSSYPTYNNFKFTGSDIYCSGNIMTLLDFKSVLIGQNITMADYAFYAMFNAQNIITPPSLPATTLTKYCYGMMFMQCDKLQYAPSLPATTLGTYCYWNMFAFTRALTKAPILPATTLTEGCYQKMFTSSYVTNIPKLQATSLPKYCYNGMFQSSKVKLSETQDAEYQYEFRIPTTGTGSTADTTSLNYMFTSSAGSFAGVPSINTTYYTTEPVV